MAHVLGFEHTLGGIAGQIFGGIGGLPGWSGIGQTAVNLSGFNAPVVQPGFNAPVTAPSTPVTTTAGVSSMQNDCTPSRKNIGTLWRNEDGTVCIKPYKTRKRRKRLATASDISDLSALKTVLSPAQVNTWLATRGRK